MDALHILVVDDEETIRAALARWFSARGFAVDTAADGQAAIEACARRRYDAVTIDLEMPRMGGLAAIPHLRKLLPDAPIVVLTGFPRNEQAALDGGANRVLCKPIRLSVLEAEIRALLPPA